MADILLTTTSTENLQPLGSAAQRSFELISGTLRERLGPDHAALMGEPVADEAGNRIDWYASSDGEAKPLAELDELEQAALRDRLSRMIGDIRAEAETLATSDAPEDQRLSEALKNATEVPDDTMIFGFRQGGGSWSPVLIHWAWVGSEQTAVRGVLSGVSPIRKPTPPVLTVQAEVRPVRRWSLVWWWLILLGWLLLAVLLGVILYILIAPCGVNRFGLLYCPAEPPAVRDEFEENPILADEVARLQRELALLDRSCQPRIPILPVRPPEPPAVPEPIAPEPVTPVPSDVPEPPVDESRLDDDQRDIVDKITQRGAKLGGLNFVLEWHSRDDIDLHVTCPRGQTISFRGKNACGGALDLDANAGESSVLLDPAENIVFENPAIGLYNVRVHLYKDRTSGGTKAFRLHVLRRGGNSQSYNGLIPAGGREWTTNISISR